MCFIPPFRVNAINGESIIRYPFFWDLLFSVEGLREGKISGSITKFPDWIPVSDQAEVSKFRIRVSFSDLNSSRIPHPLGILAVPSLFLHSLEGKYALDLLSDTGMLANPAALS